MFIVSNQASKIIRRFAIGKGNKLRKRELKTITSFINKCWFFKKTFAHIMNLVFWLSIQVYFKAFSNSILVILNSTKMITINTCD